MLNLVFSGQILIFYELNRISTILFHRRSESSPRCSFSRFFGMRPLSIRLKFKIGSSTRPIGRSWARTPSTSTTNDDGRNLGMFPYVLLFHSIPASSFLRLHFRVWIAMYRSLKELTTYNCQ